MAIGLWCTSLQRVDTVVDAEMLEEWLAMQARNPTLALSGWLAAQAIKGAASGLDPEVRCSLGWPWLVGVSEPGWWAFVRCMRLAGVMHACL